MEPLQADLEVIQSPIPFKIFSGLLKASRDGDGRLRLQGVASSTVRDRHGDNMERTAIQDMENAANENLTIFLNHSYNVPEDVAGSVERAVMIQRGADNENNEIWDLDFGIVVNDTNPRAVDAFNAIEKGTKLGLSIGAMIPEGGAVRNKKTGAYTFRHVDLLETSIVGIPANPRSWVQNMVKALKSQTTTQLGSPTLTLDGDSYRIEGKFDGTQINVSSGTSVAKGDELDESDEPVVDDPDTTSDDATDAPAEPTADDAPQATPGPDAPEVQDAKIQVITIDTDDPKGGSDGSQGASDSEPDTESDDDDVYDSAPPAGATLQDSLTSLEATAALLDVQRQLGIAIEERDAARRERDEVIDITNQVVVGASQIIEKLANMPVGRKAVLREAKDELSGLERLYSPDLLKLIRSRDNNG